MELTFLHKDAGEPGLGTDAGEPDVVRVRMGLDATTNIFAFFASSRNNDRCHGDRRA